MQKQQPNVLPWSHSTRTAYETCPRRFYLTRIAKVVKEPQGEALIHGNEVHKALELAIKREAPLPEKYKQYIPIVQRVSGLPGKRLVEHSFALTSAYKPTTFFAKDAWVRGKIDFANVRGNQGLALDWKTGKVKDEPAQLKLTAAVMFAEFPYLETVKTGYVWLQYDKVTSETYARDQVPTIWQEFLPSVSRMQRSLEKNDFPPRPSGLCKGWCPVGKANCEFCE